MRVIDYIKVDGPMPEDIPDTQYLYENGQHQFHYDKFERSKFNHDWGYIPFLPNAVNFINADFDDRDILSFNFNRMPYGGVVGSERKQSRHLCRPCFNGRIRRLQGYLGWHEDRRKTLV